MQDFKKFLVTVYFPGQKERTYTNSQHFASEPNHILCERIVCDSGVVSVVWRDVEGQLEGETFYNIPCHVQAW